MHADNSFGQRVLGVGRGGGGGGQLVCPFRQSPVLSFYLVSIFIFLFCLKELSAEGAKSGQYYDNVFTLKMHHASGRTIGRRESSKAHRQWCVRRIIRLVPIFIKGGGGGGEEYFRDRVIRYFCSCNPLKNCSVNRDWRVFRETWSAKILDCESWIGWFWKN